MVEVCPSCGDFTKYLDNQTGWCASCSGSTICSTCGKAFTPDQGRTQCSTCRKNGWLLKNADEIEEYMTTGLSLSDAKAQVQLDNTGVCYNCGEPMSTGHGGQALFCRKEGCRKIYNRYTWQRRKGLTRENALREALKK